VRSSSDVHNFLVEEGVAHEMVHLPALSKTAQKAAELLGVPTAEVVKSLLFYLDGAPTLVLVPGDLVADLGLLRAALGCAEAKLATGPQVLKVTGYRPGAVPPFALSSELPVVADPLVFTPLVVYCGGGTTTTMLKIRSSDLRDLLQPQLVTLTTRPAGRDADVGESYNGRSGRA
jgi:prolyl-tRNA editing enzyme YbaK/EbsC (Cys-tRNA(Pro) deacylase)